MSDHVTSVSAHPAADGAAMAAWVAEFAPVMAAASTPMVLMSPDGRVLHPNDAYCELLGRTAADLAGLAVTALLHPDEKPVHDEPLRTVLAEGEEEWRRQRRYLRPDGRLVVVLFSTRPVWSADGALLGFFTQLQDVTARHAAELALSRSEEMFRLTIEHAPIGMGLVDLTGRWVVVNRALCGILGRTETELLGTSVQDVSHPDDLDADAELRRQVAAGELSTIRADRRIARPDGSWVRVRATLAVARDDDGWVTHSIAQLEDLTEERRIARELGEQHRRFQMLTDGADDLVSARIRLAPELRIEHLSRSVEALTGRPPEYYYADARAFLGLVHPDDLPVLRERTHDPLAMRTTPLELRWRLEDGRVLWIQGRGEPIVDDGGAVVGVDLLAWDVTARRRAEHEVAAVGRRFRALVEHATDAIVIRDVDGVVRYASPALTRVLGLRPEEIVGTVAWLPLPGNQHAGLQHAMDQAAAAPGAVGHVEVRAVHRDGTDRWLALAIANHLDDPDVAGLVVHLHDLTEQRTAQQEIAYQARHDGLTGLPNRASLQRHLEQSLAAHPREVGVLFVDLSGVKPVNDTLGHAKGDAVLVAAAHRIAAIVGDVGRVGRFGGDEFAVVATGRGADELVGLADRIVAELDPPVTAPDGGRVYLTASVGIAFTDGTTTAEQLLANADLAMYHAKRRAGRGVQVFDATLAEHATRRLTLERDLRAADPDRDLRAHYQPVVHLGTGRIAAAEALLRWQHPVRRLVPPGDFIPVAEETGQINRLGLWILGDACREQVAWADHDVTVEVNLSPRQLSDPDLPARVADVLARTGARPDRLMLEVTESALIDDRVAGPALAALKDLGVGLALDDFGTGYSSLTSLRRYPFDTVKIDRSFVAEIARSADDRAIVRHVINLSHDLGMRVVAEGVETREQLDGLAEAGADSAQGYYLGRPAPAADLLPRLRAGARSGDGLFAEQGQRLL